MSRPLIGRTASDCHSRNFQKEPEPPGNRWFSGVETDAPDTFETHVADGVGVGADVSIPKTKLSLKICSPAPETVAGMLLEAMWRRMPPPPPGTLLDEMQVTARRLQHQTRSPRPSGRQMAKELLLGRSK